MSSYKISVLLISSLFTVGACDLGNGRDSGGGDDPATVAYTVNIIAIDAVNKDSSDSLLVEGLPVTGGTVTQE